MNFHRICFLVPRTSFTVVCHCLDTSNIEVGGMSLRVAKSVVLYPCKGRAAANH